ncbi:hypothetical protein, partial [Thermogutta sp.]|uniref:hypothetical protein n=1 Tax=Thermogutta sp. TaxID=1962930 RepID=UPI003C7C7C67
VPMLGAALTAAACALFTTPRDARLSTHGVHFNPQRGWGVPDQQTKITYPLRQIFRSWRVTSQLEAF